MRLKFVRQVLNKENLHIFNSSDYPRPCASEYALICSWSALEIFSAASTCVWKLFCLKNRLVPNFF